MVRSGATDVMFANTSMQIARLRAQRGDVAGGLDALREGVRHAADAGDRVYLAGLMQYAADVFAELDYPEPAAVVAGLVDEKGFHHFVGVEAGEWQHALETARAALGDAPLHRGARAGRGDDARRRGRLHPRARSTPCSNQRVEPTREGTEMIKGLLIGIVIFLIGTFPATWLLMLFLGNVHANVSYWGALPLGALVSVLLGGVTAQFD